MGGDGKAARKLPAAHPGGVREEMIHAVQVIAARNRFDHTPELPDRFADTEAYYESLLGRIIDELAVTKKATRSNYRGEVHYEDWTINNMEDLRESTEIGRQRRE